MDSRLKVNKEIRATSIKYNSKLFGVCSGPVQINEIHLKCCPFTRTKPSSGYCAQFVSLCNGDGLAAVIFVDDDIRSETEGVINLCS